MKVLIIGGTRFVGYHLTKTLLASGHSVTHFNRGKSNPDAFPQVETILGDRFTDLGLIPQQELDLVIDTCAYVPRAVDLLSKHLVDSAKNYLLISTISVYRDGGLVQLGSTLKEPLFDTEEVNGETYGGLKVACEQVAHDHWGDRLITLRPGLIVGPDDPTDRFTYWPLRFHLGGNILVPDCGDRRFSSVDVRDLADFARTLAEKGILGTFNVENSDLVMSELWESCLTLSPPDTRICPVAEDALLAANVKPWQTLPVWPSDALPIADASESVRNGLTYRPLATTCRDTLDWALAKGLAIPLRDNLSPDLEKTILESC